MTCEMCHENKPDAMKRMSPAKSRDKAGAGNEWPGVTKIDPVTGKTVGVIDPVLCTACCAQSPDRAWMRA